MTLNECISYLRENDDYMIISHRRPDGDTLGSGAALCSALRRAGKRAWCFDNTETTETYYPFMAPYLAMEGIFPSCNVSVDIADQQLLPVGFNGKIDLAIDHHISNTRFAERLCLAECASCGELVLDIIKGLCGDVTSAEAELLYIAVSTDTGCFQYGNTRAATLRAAAELIDLGADNVKINILMFRTISRARMSLESHMLADMQYFRGGSITAVMVTLDMIEKSGATEDDCTDISGLAGRVKGSIVSVTVREISENESKISLRSKPIVNVSDICADFDGGGHAMAAGCTLYCSPNEALLKIVAAINKKWPES